MMQISEILAYICAHETVLPIVSLNCEEGTLHSALGTLARNSNGFYSLQSVIGTAKKPPATGNNNGMSLATHRTLEQLVELRPALVGSCLLLLPWPSVQHHEDLQAVFKLEPDIVVIIYDTFGGAAGSPWLIEWLSKYVDGSAVLSSAVDKSPPFLKTAEQQTLFDSIGATRRYHLVSLLRKPVTMSQTNCMALLRRTDIHIQEHRIKYLPRA
jgi:hypothetical protein